eukprot:15433109-Alexandrium_andersonii.AAC.1
MRECTCHGACARALKHAAIHARAPATTQVHKRERTQELASCTCVYESIQTPEVGSNSFRDGHSVYQHVTTMPHATFGGRTLGRVQT